MKILALPVEIRDKIYRMVLDQERAKGVLSSSRWIGYCKLLRIKFNDELDYREREGRGGGGGGGGGEKGVTPLEAKW